MATYGQAIYGVAVYQSAGAIPHAERKTKTMASLSIETLIGYSNEVEGLLTKYKTQCTAGKYDPTDDMVPMSDERTALTTADRDQEALKTQLKAATDQVNTLATGMEQSVGQKLDRAIAALGKSTLEGQEAQEIRAKLHRKRNTAAAARKTSTTPTP